MNHFRIGSYNICKAIGFDLRRKPERSLRIISQLNTDIMVLQEADQRFNDRQAIFTPEQIEAETGLRVVDFNAELPGLGWYGNILLLREGITVRDFTLLELPGLEPRGTVIAELSLGAHRLSVGAMHLGLRRTDRKKQLDEIIDHVQTHNNDGCILTGDLNAWKKVNRAMEKLHVHFEMADCGPSFPAIYPIVPLDRIFYSDNLQLRHSEVYKGKSTKIASDHLPIFADFAFGKDHIIHE